MLPNNQRISTTRLLMQEAQMNNNFSPEYNGRFGSIGFGGFLPSADNREELAPMTTPQTNNWPIHSSIMEAIVLSARVRITLLSILLLITLVETGATLNENVDQFPAYQFSELDLSSEKAVDLQDWLESSPNHVLGNTLPSDGCIPFMSAQRTQRAGKELVDFWESEKGFYEPFCLVSDLKFEQSGQIIIERFGRWYLVVRAGQPTVISNISPERAVYVENLEAGLHLFADGELVEKPRTARQWLGIPVRTRNLVVVSPNDALLRIDVIEVNTERLPGLGQKPFIDTSIGNSKDRPFKAASASILIDESFEGL